MVGTRSVKVRPDPAVGTCLRRARQERRLTIEAVAAQLRIPTRQLQALEEGDFSVFAAEVYARGAYMQYISYLGLDEQSSQRMISRVLSGARERVPLRLHTPLGWFERFVSPRRILMAALGLVALGVGTYVLWQVQSFLRLPDVRLSEPASGVADKAALMVRGVADHEARVQVNGETMLLQEDGSFETALRLHPGINVLQVTAENAAGRGRVIEKHVLLSR